MKRLDLKYRPTNFDKVIGQDNTTKYLKETLKNNDFSECYMIHGAHGSGKTTLSRIIGMSILCENKHEDGNPCGECESCKGILNKSNPNYREEDGGSQGGIEQIRQIISENLYTSFDGSRYKIIVFDEAHGITKAGQNALLKELEEGSSAIFIFCTTEPQKVLPTVVSRCLNLEVLKPSIQDIKARLIEICELENITYEEKALELLIKSKKSHIRDCLKEIDKISSIGPVTLENIEEYLQADIANVYFEILLDLKDNLPVALKKAEKLMSKLLVGDIYTGLATAALDSYKFKLDLESDLTLTETKIVGELWNSLKDSLFQISAYLIEQTAHKLDRITLLTDLIKLSNSLQSSPGKITNFKENIRETINLDGKINSDPEKLISSGSQSLETELDDSENMSSESSTVPFGAFPTQVSIFENVNEDTVKPEVVSEDKKYLIKKEKFYSDKIKNINKTKTKKKSSNSVNIENSWKGDYTVLSIPEARIILLGGITSDDNEK